MMPFLLPLFRNVLFITSALIVTAVTGQTLVQASRWWSVICTVCNLITVAVLLLLCKRENRRFMDLIGDRKGKSKVLTVAIIVIVMLVLGMGGMVAFGLLLFGQVPSNLLTPLPIWVAAVNVVLLPATVIFAEMPLYYGYCVPAIEEATRNKYLAVLYPVFFYALQHSFMPLLWDVRFMVFRFLSFLPLMLFLGVWYYKKRNLVPIMIGHAILDLAAGVQILVLSINPQLYQLMTGA